MIIRRKIDDFLNEWKNNPNRKPLIIKGARQIGKTFSILQFANANYDSVVSINFVLQPKYRTIFDDGYEVDSVVKNISMIDSDISFVPGRTLIFFDELQQQPAAATALKAFAMDRRYDVICSGSLMGLNYQEIESNSVGYKEDYTMTSLDFEEFLWAKGYNAEQISGWLVKMVSVTPLSETEMLVLSEAFRDYMVVGGMPAIVATYLANHNFTGILAMQRQLLADYAEDITKYAVGLDKSKIKNVYEHISVFLAQSNKKFQISKVGKNARSRDYVGTVDWLSDAGIINICYCLNEPALPLRGNYNPSNYKIYFHDSGMLIASLDDEAQMDLRANRNFNTYKGAVYESAVAEMLVKQGYRLYFYRNDKSTVEMDFFVRDTQSLIPVEVKAQDGATKTLNRLIESREFADIKFGIKLCLKNIGFNGRFYTFPYFLGFLLRRFLSRVDKLNQLD